MRPRLHPPSPWRALPAAALAAALVAGPAPGQDAADAVLPLPALATARTLMPTAAADVAVRVTWGGGRPRRWSGTIRVLDAAGAPRPAGGAAPAWRLLATDGLAATRVTAGPDGLVVRQSGETALDEIELRVPDDPAAMIAVHLVPDGLSGEGVDVRGTVGEVIRGQIQRPLDGEANRLTLRRAPGDDLRVAVEGGTVRSPGDVVRLHLQPLLPPHDGGGASFELRVRVREGVDGTDTYSRTWLLRPSPPAAEPSAGPTPQRFDPISIDVPLPAREGAWDIAMQVTERGGLRWARPLATRVVQVVAVSATPPAPGEGAEWRVIEELDPASPRLLERLRRIPVVGRGAAALPHVQLPMVTLPKVPLPSVSMPRIPGAGAVGAVVPRVAALLPSGHATLDAHPSGARFRLPPARSAAEPSWEAIHLAGVVPGAPHRLEITLPADEPALVSATVLEQVGGSVIATFEGGFATEAVPGAPGLVRHALVFRPQSRAPLLVVGNPSPSRPVWFGTVRILAGPPRLDPLPVALVGRRVWGVVDALDLTGLGGPYRVDGDAAGVLADWRTILTAARSSAESLAARGAAGAMVTVHADGASAWPAHAAAPPPARDRAAADAGLDPLPKDVLEVLCRVHGRQGLRVVPAVDCSGPLPAVEAALAAGGQAAEGILSVGRDGRPVGQSDGAGRRYNILDPAVQAALEDLVADLATRSARHDAVDGLALLLPHDGWFHLPGVAAALDDATFSRFLADVPAAAAIVAAAGPDALRADAGRYALRAALVEGPLREPWIEWRAASVADLVGRLARRVASLAPGRTLSIVPTTLFAEGDLAARVRPVLAVGPGGDVPRDAGLDVARITAHDGVVWVSPHVHAPLEDFIEREAVAAANHAPGSAAAAAAARRRAAIRLDRPASIDLRTVLAQGALAGSAPTEVAAIRAVPGGTTRTRALAEILAAADCERIYDAALLWHAGDEADVARDALLAALPSARMETMAGVPAPLVVRVAREGGGMLLTNASGAACRAIVDRAAAAGETVPDALPVDLGPWQSRAVAAGGPAALAGVRVTFDPAVEAGVRARLDGLRLKRAALEMPVPLTVLDNPGFEHPDHTGGIPGWELLEGQRGRLRIVPGAPDGGGRGLEFASDNGLATLRSNPFPPPATGRVSVALWLRVAADAPLPPLRIAVEGVHEGREYYRFAPVGAGPNARAPGAEWAQFVLQVDDLPSVGLETLRVRLDLLAGGAVQVDDVRVFDLAFDEAQRVRLARSLALVEERLAAGDLGACAVELDRHWARFLDAFVSEAAAARAETARQASAEVARGDGDRAPEGSGSAAETPRTGLLDRVRRWWK